MTTYLNQLLETLETIPTKVTSSLVELRQFDEVVGHMTNSNDPF
jgi:hypothetical protein